MKNKSFIRAGLMAVIFFMAGFLCSPVIIGIWKARFVVPVHHRERKEAYSFFYRTMHELFEDTYNPDDDLISKDTLDYYKKYADRLGGKCRVHLEKDSAGNFTGQAFFPSGDVVDVVVFRGGGRLQLAYFFPRNWKQLWTETLDWYGVSHTKQDTAEPVENR